MVLLSLPGAVAIADSVNLEGLLTIQCNLLRSKGEPVSCWGRYQPNRDSMLRRRLNDELRSKLSNIRLQDRIYDKPTVEGML